MSGSSTSVWSSIVHRVAVAAATLWAAVTLTFFAIQLAPGSTIDALVGEGPDTPEIRARIIQEWGLDHPLVVQYLTYLWRLLHGDLGTSYTLERPVSDVLGSQLLPTVELAVAAILVACTLALLSAVVTAGRPWLRALVSNGELVLVSMPSFWLGILLLAAFSFRLGWFPVSGDEGWIALVLPTLTLALQIAGVLSQVLRQGLEWALEQPFAVTARSRGITRRALLLRHGLRHSLIPAVTLSGWVVGGLLGGTVITEQVFGRPGLGQVALTAVNSQDIPVVLAVVLLSTLAYVVISGLVDLSYLAIDPRLRAGR
jgi:peptide/nickel transport system permease protein